VANVAAAAISKSSWDRMICHKKSLRGDADTKPVPTSEQPKSNLWRAFVSMWPGAQAFFSS
jgi:hypothetical protein